MPNSRSSPRALTLVQAVLLVGCGSSTAAIPTERPADGSGDGSAATVAARVVPADSLAAMPRPDGPATTGSPGDGKDYVMPLTVRFVYMVSADRTERADYLAAIGDAARSVQAFYAAQQDGLTFQLNEPAVEVVTSDKPAAWFYANPHGDAQDDWGFQNTLDEARRLLWADFDQDYVWVIYSDGPGDKGRGTNGVAVMPEDDLRGLTGTLSLIHISEPTRPY